MTKRASYEIPLISVVWLLFAFWSCTGSTGGGAVTYPPGWPDSSITVPPGSVRAKYRLAGLVGSENDGYTVTGNTLPDLDVYGVGFRYNGNTIDIHSHLENVLLPKGFKFKEENDSMRVYSLDDKDVRLYYDQKDGHSYMLSIHIYH